MHRSLLLSLLLSFPSMLSFASVPARAEDPLVGKRVVVIRDKATLEASGKEVAKVRECTVFTVGSVDGSWLWIKSERAYLRRADVVPFEDAIGHYTRLLETNRTANNYWNRAQIWRMKGELDIALGDMNDAIRLNPTESALFLNRGILWKNKKDYDKAIADYSEAIRLNPKSGAAYTCRGNVWGRKKEYDKAIADFDEALKHIDPNEKVGLFSDSDITGGDSTAMVNSRAVTLNNVAWLRATCPGE
ncbi:MAG: tetratricopeptide repeat protein, partial [Planctomycetaceae bacterium]|nr:tetratricopeptide repeat protein [Planctomycetaceae bacterium]